VKSNTDGSITIPAEIAKIIRINPNEEIIIEIWTDLSGGGEITIESKKLQWKRFQEDRSEFLATDILKYEKVY